MIVRGKRNKQDRNWFHFNLSFESSSFIFNNFKTEKLNGLPLKDETDQFVTCLVLPECLSVKIAFHPRTVKRIVMAPMPSLLFRCFSLFLPHLRTLAQEKRSEIVFVLGLVGRVSVSIHYCREISEYFSPRSQWPLERKKILTKRFARSIRVHYRDLENAYIY